MEFSGPRHAFSPIGRAFIARFASLTPKAISMCAALAIALTILLGLLHALIKWKAPHLYLFVTNQPQMADSWYPMRAAIDAWNSEHSRTLYQTVFFERHIKFQYPPSSLLIYSFGGPLTDNTLNAISWVCLWIYCVCCGMIAARLIETTFASQALRPASPTLAFAFGFLTCISFYPCLQSFWLGQAQTWLNAAFGLACLCWILDRKGAAGVLIGLSCAMKPQFALFVLWAAARRDWRFVLGWAAVVVPLELSSLYIFGLQNHLDYLKVLAFISSRGEAFVPNQTINGLLNRALGNGELTWADGEFAPHNFIVHMGTVSTSLAETEAAVRDALAAQGFGVLTEIDVAATLKAKIDVDRPPLKILGACNPTFAHRALELDERVSLMLPCNVVVSASNGTTTIRAVDPRDLMPSGEFDELTTEVAHRLQTAVDAVPAG
mgnify:CR=1 FL=1